MEGLVEIGRHFPDPGCVMTFISALTICPIHLPWEGPPSRCRLIRIPEGERPRKMHTYLLYLLVLAGYPLPHVKSPKLVPDEPERKLKPPKQYSVESFTVISQIWDSRN